MKHLPNNADQPSYPIDTEDVVFTGLSKREEFAKAAMSGLLAFPGQGKDEALIASLAVRCADASLAELERTKR
jgi:hypothetical protein